MILKCETTIPHPKHVAALNDLKFYLPGLKEEKIIMLNTRGMIIAPKVKMLKKKGRKSFIGETQDSFLKKKRRLYKANKYFISIKEKIYMKIVIL
jgi:hypothetical protein